MLAAHMNNGVTESQFKDIVFKFVMMTDGLDYNSLGRNLDSIYKLYEEEESCNTKNYGEETMDK